MDNRHRKPMADPLALVGASIGEPVIVSPETDSHYAVYAVRVTDSNGVDWILRDAVTSSEKRAQIAEARSDFDDMLSDADNAQLADATSFAFPVTRIAECTGQAEPQYRKALGL